MPCKVADLLADLAGHIDGTILAGWLDSTEVDARGYPVSRVAGQVVSANALATALHHEGHTVAPITLKDHRARRCGCSRQAVNP